MVVCLTDGCITCIGRTPALVEAVEMFRKRFVTRLADMTRDIEPKIAQLAIKLLSSFLQ
jgi:hypothetical protein